MNNLFIDAAFTVVDLDVHLWDDIGGALTCDEADAFWNLLVLGHNERSAQRLLEAHQESDTEGDKHYTGS